MTRSLLLFCVAVFLVFSPPAFADAERETVAATVVDGTALADGDEKNEDEKKDDAANDKKEEPKPEEPKPEPPKQESPKEEPKPEPTKPEPLKPEPPKPEPPKVEPPKQEPAKPKLDSIEVTTDPVKTRLTVAGQFESAEAAVIRLKSKEFAAFELVEAVPHAAKVARGDVLIRFSEKKYQDALAERRRAMRLSELALRDAELSLAALRARRPLQFEEMEVAQRENNDDHNYFQEYERDLARRLNEFRRRSSDISLESSREELRQLEKMYEADDLVEDTEEFILKRTRFQVEASEFDYKTNQETIRRMLEVTLGRRDRSAALRKRFADIDYERAKEVFPFAEEQAAIAFERTKQAHATLVENMEKFLADEKWLVIKAPCDGIVYYGEYDQGKWQGGAIVQQSFKVGEAVKNDSVLMTIVEPRPTRFRVVIPERDLGKVVPDIVGQIAPTAFPETRFRARILDIPPYPSAANEYVAKFVVRNTENSRLVPGMTGNIEMVVYDNKDAILVPTSATKQEPLDDDSYNHRYVWVVSADGTSSVKTKVQTGITVGDKTEIRGNLSKGQQILKTPPAK